MSLPLPWPSVCLLVMASRVDRGAPLVVGANRDERLERLAKPIAILQGEGPRILGGRDEEAGGTWLAVNEFGVVAALTNRPSRDGRDPSKRSRGELPIALAGHGKAADAVDEFVRRFDPTEFNRAWLLVGDRLSLYAIDMTGEHPSAFELPPGVHILENLPYGTPSPKVDHVREMLGEVGRGGREGDDLELQLARVLSDHLIPEVVAHEDSERPPETRAACVHTENYGTRSSSILRVHASEEDQITVKVASGHPCEEPYVDYTHLWNARLEPGCCPKPG